MLSLIIKPFIYIQSWVLSFFAAFNNSSRFGFLYILIPIIVVALLIVLFFRYRRKIQKSTKPTVDSLNELLETSGYAYDSNQDVFYTHIESWQRAFGYCRLYDEAATPLGMIIDSEPIYFYFEDRLWMIELWKGQYNLTTGCEIGVYKAVRKDLKIENINKTTFFKCVGDNDLIEISYKLLRHNKKLFTREGKHWWQTGFILGEFSNPSDLVMDISITLKDRIMRNAFITGLKRVGYKSHEILAYSHTVNLIFDKPYTKKVATRNKNTEYAIQWKNKFLCNQYQEITAGYDTLPEKLDAMRKESPIIYQKIMDLGKGKKIFDIFKTLDTEE